MVTKEERSKQIWVFRFWAILSVCCAHLPMNNQQGTIDIYLNWILGLFGTLGVGGFFVCSGYYFSVDEARGIAYWKKRFYKLIVPWLLLGAITRVWYNYISDTRPILQGYRSWVLGQGTWMYFVPVLVELTILFTICKNKKMIYVIGVLSLCSNVSVILGYGYYTVFTPYMNPLNWAIFFILGLVWKEKEKTVEQIKKVIHAIACIAFVVITILFFLLDTPGYYWTWLSIPFEICGIILLFSFSFFLRNCRLLQNIGKNTLFIFMIHMIPCGAVINHISDEGLFGFMRPVAALLITYAGAWVLRKTLNLLNLKWMMPILGLGGE